MKVIAFIDGFNLYYSLENIDDFRKYKWLDFTKMFSHYLINKEDTVEIHYFTTINYNEISAYKSNKSKYKEKYRRHMDLINAQRSKDVKIHYGAFKDKDFLCESCGYLNTIRQEKQSDVNLASFLIYFALNTEFERFIVLSADTDLIPAFNLIKKHAENKRLDLLLPPGNKKSKLSEYCYKTYLLKTDVLNNSQFPNPVMIKDGSYIYCPKEWDHRS